MHVWLQRAAEWMPASRLCRKGQEQAFIKKEIAEGKDETTILQDMSISIRPAGAIYAARARV